ncbi:PilZ domain-containing protein [bacterium]|nr:PilZ domain-containing protein [candidate division CSSED10-310 bacterium]
MTTQSNSDRRRSERFKTINFVSYRDKDDQGSVIAEGMAKTLDISLNGAMIELQAPLVNPQTAELEFALDDEVVSLPGLVIDQQEELNGSWKLRVEFKNLKPAILHKLQTFILSFR